MQCRNVYSGGTSTLGCCFNPVSCCELVVLHQHRVFHCWLVYKFLVLNGVSKPAALVASYCFLRADLHLQPVRFQQPVSCMTGCKGVLDIRSLVCLGSLSFFLNSECLS
jgi:hypothetical protein